MATLLPATRSPAADIWSLGAILRELLAASPSTQTDLGRIGATCLRSNPADRYSSADELAEALRQCLERMG